MAQDGTFDKIVENSVIASIYDAALNDTLWASALEAVCRAVGAEVSALFHRDMTSVMKQCIFTSFSGWTTELLNDYKKYYGNLDVRRVPISALSPGQVFADEREMPFADVTNSEIFRDFYRPAGLGNGMAMVLFGSRERSGVLSVHRGLSGGAFPDQSIAFFERLTPHVIRALQLHGQMRRAEVLANGLALTLDHFPLAVLLVDEGRTIRHMNKAAAEVLQRPGWPLRVTAGRLETRLPRHDALLRRELANAASLAWDRGGPATSILRLEMAGVEGTVAVMVSPLRDGGAMGMPAEPLTAVFMSDPAQSLRLDTEMLARQFGMTPAEARIATSLAKGESLDEAASARGISIETARTLLKRATAKAEVRTQGQLIARVARSLATLRWGR